MVNNQWIKDTTAWRPSKVFYLSSASALEIKRDQGPIAVMDSFFSFEEARVAFKEFGKYHCASFEDENYIAWFAWIPVSQKKAVFQAHIAMQDMHTSQNMTGQKNEGDGSMRPYPKWSSRKAGRFHFNLVRSGADCWQSLQRTFWNKCLLCVESSIGNDGNNPHSEFQIVKEAKKMIGLIARVENA